MYLTQQYHDLINTVLQTVKLQKTVHTQPTENWEKMRPPAPPLQKIVRTHADAPCGTHVMFTLQKIVSTHAEAPCGTHVMIIHSPENSQYPR